MVQKVLERSDYQGEEARCQHYWVLKGPTHEVMVGLCRYCGKRRNFQTGGAEQVREEERHADMEYWGVGDLIAVEGEGSW